MGFDSSRGDLLTIEDLPFDANHGQVPPTLLSKSLAAAEGSPVLVKYAAILAGILVIVAFGVRPAVHRLSLIHI